MLQDQLEFCQNKVIQKYRCATCSLLLLIVCTVPGILLAQVKKQHDWENEQVININKEPAHVTTIPYPDVETALETDRKKSPYYKSLNGQWKFHWSPKPSERPQENGNKTDVRWTRLTNENGKGLLVVADSLLNISAWPYSMQNLEEADHINELDMGSTVTFNIDYKQMGVGGDNSWGARPHKEYRLPARKYQYGFRLIPINRDTDISNKIEQRVE